MGEIWYDLDNPEELKIAREVSAVNKCRQNKETFAGGTGR